jgi:hypothetical protein
MLNLIPLPYRILAILLLGVGLFSYGYFKGHHSASQKADERMAKFEADAKAKYDELYNKKSQIDEKVVTKYVDRVVYVTKWRNKNVEIARTVPDNGMLSNGWVHVHDASATASAADPTKAADGSSSGVTATEALGGVVDNYGTCKANAEKLIALQNWIKEQELIVEETNNKKKKWKILNSK